jgi:hypothetical protein
VNYVNDRAEYPMIHYLMALFDQTEYSPQANVHQGGQYSPHGSATHYHSDPTPFHLAAYEIVGYFPTDGPLCSPLEGQHQQCLVPITSGYSYYYDCLAHYSQPPIPGPPILPSSSFSELGHALAETPPESQSINHGTIAADGDDVARLWGVKYDLSEPLVGLNTVKTEYTSAVSEQPFSPMTSRSTLSLSCELAPHPKEEGQEQIHGFSTAVVSHGHLPMHHRQHTHDSFCLVQDAAAYPVFTSLPPSKAKSKVWSPSHIPRPV